MSIYSDEYERSHGEDWHYWRDRALAAEDSLEAAQDHNRELTHAVKDLNQRVDLALEDLRKLRRERVLHQQAFHHVF